ncbi:hypothetical protein [Nocardioides jejuensis]|uniref:Uncharacterized protein n=1 Tax=Nocardioides jejuensis TaxID=2502782 RepID=A0A4R1CHK5_9ACTN|nr:hypothetical protein [Nocardioides jejuensis]TCJ30760.1 hypothetical protein EPD65_01615 [Nocardioides jejuensis]
MKPLVLGLALLAAVTGFSRLPAAHAPADGNPGMVIVPRSPVVPSPQLTVQPIPTDGWDDGELPSTH